MILRRPAHVFGLLLVAGCSEAGPCVTDGECPAGRICVVGECRNDPSAGAGGVSPDGGEEEDSELEPEPEPEPVEPDGAEPDSAEPDGAAGGPCTAPGTDDLVLHEILADPGGADVDGNGAASATGDEFIEIVNVSGHAVGLAGVSVRVGEKSILLGTGCLASYEPRVLWGKETPLGLANDGGTVRLLVGEDVVHEHTYGPEAGKDRSLTLSIQLDRSSAWVRHDQISASPWSPGKCSNGKSFPECGPPATVTPPEPVADPEPAPPDPDPAAPDPDPAPQPDVPPPDPEPEAAGCGPAAGLGSLVLNEVLADPGGADVNGDGNASSSQDEFVELVNPTAGPVELAGVVLLTGKADPYDVVHTFAAGCLAPGEGIVLFGGGTPALAVEGSAIAKSQKSLSLNNDGDTILLRSAAGETLDSHTYKTLKGQSWARDPDGSGPFVKHADATASAGAVWSPGRCLDGSPLPFCLK